MLIHTEHPSNEGKHIAMRPFYGRLNARSRDSAGTPVCVRIVTITQVLANKAAAVETNVCPNCGKQAEWVSLSCTKCELSARLSACCLYTTAGLEDAPMDIERDGSKVGPESVKKASLQLVC